MVVDLRDRLPPGLAAETVADAADAVRRDVLSALANLGYQRASAEKALDRVLGRSGASTTPPGPAFEPLLREVLKELAR
jgi:Holliday junction resolvasome RuvABC DNA-binding subunit